MPAPRLGAARRERLERVAAILYTNPFGEIRGELARVLGREPPPPGRGRGHPLGALEPVVETQVRELEGEGLGRLDAVAEAGDRVLLKHLFLFEVYHRFVAHLDRLIEEQLRLRARPVAVDFARPALGALAHRGFGDAESLRYFALFFQLRRAYHFIAESLVGDSPSMGALRRSLWNHVFTHDVRRYDEHLWNRMEDFSTLLLGETGSGKGAAAAAIGRSGFIPFDAGRGVFAESFTETFIATNLSQFPESLIESELFGHRKGAFTGAVDHHTGLFERCSPHGSLFLDEIGDVSVPVQIKLLNVLQDRTFTPVGSHQEKRFSGRIIAATHRPLAELRARGSFRDDFFYRLSSEAIRVPPLRQRIAESGEELPRLISLLVARLTGEGDGPLGRHVLEVIRRDRPADYPWPGNVRELEQAVRQVLLSDRCPLPAHDSGVAPAEADAALDARAVLGRHCAELYRRLGSYSEVARRVGLDWRTVRKYVEDHGRAR